MKSMKIAVFVMSIFAVMVVGCSAGEEKEAGAYPNAHLLVEPDWLESNVDGEKVAVIDVRSEGYEQGHIPGAVHLDRSAIHIPDIDIKNKLVDAETFTKVLQNAGIDNDTTVVVYDEGNALWAARLFYALEYYGHTDVKVLNGGYAGWLTAGKDISVDPATVGKGSFVAKADSAKMTEKQDILDQLNESNLVFLDARTEGEFSGEDTRGNAKGGHIPGALNIEWNIAVVKGEDGVERFKSYEELKEIYAPVLEQDKKVVTYCQTNIRGAHSYFTLRLLGHDDISPYENSMIEWNNTDDTPVETN